MYASKLIDAQIAKQTGWKKETMIELRNIINSSSKLIIEDWKWSAGVWTYNSKPIVAFSAFKSFVKINFFLGSKINDSKNMFNSGLDSKLHRSINYGESEKPNKKVIAQFIKDSINLIQ
jgi:hypothetical protein